jgi:hypothetical protein
MKKVLLLAVPLLISGLASAQTTPGLCGFASYTVAQLTTSGFSCYVNDKLYGNFGNFSSNWGAEGDTLQFFQLAGQYNLFANAATSFGGTYTFSYTVNIDQTKVGGGATASISAVGGSISDSGTTEELSKLTKLITPNSGSPCTVTVSHTGGLGENSNLCTFNTLTTSLSVVETFTAPTTGSTVGFFQNSISQVTGATSAVPEPASMLLLGGGLLGLGVLGRKRYARR